MCIFCAAIPATVAASASIQHKQRKPESAGPTASARPFPIKKVTTVVVAGLVVGSVVTHTHLMGGL